MTIGVILAGGSASRLGGGDKGLREVGGRTILDRIAATLRRQCGGLVVNASIGDDRFEPYADALSPDDVAGRPGPLAGVLAGLDWVAAHRPGAAFAVTVPTDSPFLPDDLVERLGRVQARTAAPIVCARSGGRTHHVTALWSVATRHDLRRALVDEDVRQVRWFIERYADAQADWPTEPYDPFFNVNTPGDLREAERIARELGA